MLLSQTNAVKLQNNDTDEGEIYKEDENPYHMMAKYLLEHSANPDIRTYTDKRSPLMTTCASLDDALIELLIEYKANINLLDANDSSAMHYAANPVIYSPNERIGVIEYLMQHGGNVYYNVMHWTPKAYLNNDDASFALDFDELVQQYHPKIIGANTTNNH